MKELLVVEQAALQRKLAKTRRLLYGLAAINLAVIVFVLYLVIGYPTGGDNTITADRTETSGMSKFEITSTKTDLELAMNSFLQRFADGNSSGLSYKLSLSDVIRLHGDVEILGIAVPLEVALEPSVTGSGDLLLTQKSFKVGGLPIPSTLVLEYVRSSFNFPDWILIQPSRREILAATTAMQTDGDMFIRVREFNLDRDQFRFEVWLR